MAGTIFHPRAVGPGDRQMDKFLETPLAPESLAGLPDSSKTFLKIILKSKSVKENFTSLPQAASQADDRRHGL